MKAHLNINGLIMEVRSKVATYGRLYSWYAVTDSRNVCPTGWHVPTDAEWTTLTSTLGGESTSALKLKEAGTTHWSINTGTTNESEFTALPGGGRFNTFNDIGSDGYWWSTTAEDAWNAWRRYMSVGINNVGRDGNSDWCGLSVRCVKD